MMKKLLGYFFVLTMFTLIVSCEEEEFTDIQTSSSSNKAIDFGSHSENAVSDFQTDSDRPLSHVYYGDYVEKRNEYGVSYTYGIISVNPKDYASGPKDYYENMVVVITNDGKENGFVMRYDSKTDKPISWIPIYGTVLSFPCGYVQITTNVPCSCAGHPPGYPTCECSIKGYTVSYPQGIPCGAVFTDGDDVSDPVGYNVGGSKGLGGSGSTNPSGMGSATHIPGNHYPESIAEVPFTQVPEVKVIDEETEMKIAAIESFTNTQDQAVNDWLTRNHSSPLIDELFDVFTSSFTLDGNTSSAIQIINEVLTFVTENNSQEAEDFAIDYTNIVTSLNHSDIDIQSAIASGVTTTAEYVHELYMELVDLVNQNPQYIEYANYFVDHIRDLAEMVVDTNPETCGWADLTNMWLFELGDNPIQLSDTDYTTEVLKNLEGVNDARNIAINEIENDNLNIETHTWVYDQEAFYDGMSEGNLATSFLGSYSIDIEVTHISGNQYQLDFYVHNKSSWESATRLRIDNDHNGSHDGIILSKERGEGINFGGDFEQDWSWSETVTID